MEMTTLDWLLGQGGVDLLDDGLAFTVHPSWIVPGEDRLSYTTLIRLVECCREHHWIKDVLPKAEGIIVDSTIKSIAGEFTRSILVGSAALMKYEIADVRSKGYSLRFQVYIRDSFEVVARFCLVSIFIDDSQHQAVFPPPDVLEYLVKACKKTLRR